MEQMAWAIIFKLDIRMAHFMEDFSIFQYLFDNYFSKFSGWLNFWRLTYKPRFHESPNMLLAIYIEAKIWAWLILMDFENGNEPLLESWIW